MSRKKRKTMRGLKRVLGVSAIILALLIAAIPDVGRAQTKDGSTKSQAEGGGIALLSLEPDMGGLPGDGEIDPGTGGSEGGEMLPGAGDSAEDGWADPQAGDTEAGEETGPDEPQEAYPMLLAPAEPDADAGESENPSVTPEETEQLPSLGVSDGAWKNGKVGYSVSDQVKCQDDRYGGDYNDAMDVSAGIQSEYGGVLYVLVSHGSGSGTDVNSKSDRDTLYDLRNMGDEYDAGADFFSIGCSKRNGANTTSVDHVELTITMALPFPSDNPPGYYDDPDTRRAVIYGKSARSGLWEALNTSILNPSADNGNFFCVQFSVNPTDFNGQEYIWQCYDKKKSSSSESASTASSEASTASTAGSSASSSATSAGNASTSGTGSSTSTAAYYEFNVNDDMCYSDKLGTDGAYAELNPAPKTGIWWLTIEDVSAPALVTASQDLALPYRLSEKATTKDYKTFQLTSLTEDGYWASIPVDAKGKASTMNLYMPIPASSDPSSSLSSATSFMIRGYKQDNNTAILVAEQLKPVKDTKNGTSQMYVCIPITRKTYENLGGSPTLIMYATPSGSSGSSSSGNELGIEVDTPKDDEEMAAGTTDDVSTIWGLGEPKASRNMPEGKTDDVTKYRLLITRYSDLKAATIDDKIKKDKALTGYKSNSKIEAYEIKVHMIGGRGETYPYPTTPEELENRTFSIKLPYQKAKAGTVTVYTMKNGSSLEWLAGPEKVEAGKTKTVSFTASHFSQFALLYTPDAVTPSPSPSGGTNSSPQANSNSSQSSNKASTASSSASNSSSNTGASNNNNGSSNNSNNNSSNTGGGGNSASGNGRVDMPRTADATTYKAIIILILLAFGAFELISSLPAKKQTAGRG